MTIFRWILLRIRDDSDKGFRENQNMKFDIRIFFRKAVDKIRILSKSDMINGHFTHIPTYIFDDNIALDSS
jgi:hypothetical protein